MQADMADKTDNKVRGNLGEDLAVTFLQNHGYEIIDRNVAFKMGEIDIVAKDKSILCFIEVRSKQNNHFGNPETSVNYDKQKRITKAAAAYLQRNFYGNPPLCRFDVVAVLGYGSDAKVKLFKAAFEAPVEYGRRGRSPWQAY